MLKKLIFFLPICAIAQETSAPLSVIPGLEKNRFDSAIRSVAKLDDPTVDGWSTEAFNETSGEQFNKIADFLASDHKTFPKGLAHPAFRLMASPARGATSAFQDQSLSLLRAASPDLEISESFQKALIELAEPLAGLSEIRSKFKTIRVEPGDEGTTTVTYVQIGGRDLSKAVQLNATWKCLWDASRDPPLLKSIEVSNDDQVSHSLKNGQSIFSECTRSVFQNPETFDRQLIYGIDHWTSRFDGAIARPAAGHGLAIGDVNGDGLEDLYLCQPPALPNLLLIQNPDGTVTDTALAAGVNWHEETRAALLNDLDNDGDLDLVAVLGSKVVVQANDGSGKFELKTVIDSASSLFSINAIDYDGDQDLDLFICGYTLSSGVNLDDVFANPMPFEDANNGAPNLILRNEGGWNFTDVTSEVGLDQNNMRFSYASSWDDFDRDGDLDLYVANDFGRNNLYRNDGGKFTDVAADLGVEDIGPGMSASWGDYNNDGFPDIYVSNMFSSAGNRITTQSQFKAGLKEEDKLDFRRHARGNSLFRNRGDGTFEDVSVELGVTLGRWAWGSTFVDMNNDGWEDLYVTNGFLTAQGKDRDL